MLIRSEKPTPGFQDMEEILLQFLDKFCYQNQKINTIIRISGQRKNAEKSLGKFYYTSQKKKYFLLNFWISFLI